MKYIKTYEDLNDEPNLGDYVITTVIISDVDPKLKFFLENNVGKICKIEDHVISYLVKYENTPFDLFIGINDNYKKDVGYWWFDKLEIKIHSSNKEECEAYLNAKKYNL